MQGRWLRSRLEALLGGPARLKVVAILAAALGLDGADKGTLSATASNLEQVFHIGNTEIGLLVTASTLVGAAATIPVGALTDRVRRTRLLAGSIALWALAMGAGAMAHSYLWLIVSRMGLGAVTATVGPTVGSLTGDFFPPASRARMYGFILGGELLGTGCGFVVSGVLAAHLGWRWAFWWLVPLSGLLTYVVARLREPARGGGSALREGQARIAGDVGDGGPDERSGDERSGDERSGDGQSGDGQAGDGQAGEGQAGEGQEIESRQSILSAIEGRDIEPYPSQVLTEDPARKPLWWAVGYILRVRTDVVIIVASALGYFYFAGVRTFAILFAQNHYGVSKTGASGVLIIIGLGALVGIHAGGRTADRLLHRGVVSARILVPTVVLFTIPVFLAPAFWVTSLWVAVPLLTVGGGLLGAANPPQDAARLDIIHPHLWGRSEGVRSALRGLLAASAPVTFGWVSEHWFGTSVSYGSGPAAHGSPYGVAYTFMLFLLVLVLAGLIVTKALRTYPRDVATAAESARKTLR